jgi:hypothetical protein
VAKWLADKVVSHRRNRLGEIQKSIDTTLAKNESVEP